MRGIGIAAARRMVANMVKNGSANVTADVKAALQAKSQELARLPEHDFLRNSWLYYWGLFASIPYPFKPEEFVVAGRGFKFDDYHYHRMFSLALEFDGRCHLNPDKWERDHEKMAIAASLGILVVALTYKQIMEEPERYVLLVESMVK